MLQASSTLCTASDSVGAGVRPKSVARDLYERAMTFHEYVAHYQLARSEGLVLRYLSDAYKALVQTVPEDAKTPEVDDLSEWLGEMVRQVDSSLIDEWESLQHPGPEDLVGGKRAAGSQGASLGPDAPPPVTANPRAFRVMVRNAAFRRVERAARRDWDGLAEGEPDGGFGAGEWEAAMADYFAEHPEVGTGAPARSGQLFGVLEGPDRWRVRQVLDDPAGDHDWAMIFDVDLAASGEAGTAVLRTVAVERAGEAFGAGSTW